MRWSFAEIQSNTAGLNNLKKTDLTFKTKELFK